MTKNNIGASIPVTVDSATTDWAALKDWLNTSRIENYLKIIAIIDDNSIAEADKNATIRKQFPVAYNFMLRTWYPKLRTTDISIEHTPAKIDVAEAKKLGFTACIVPAGCAERAKTVEGIRIIPIAEVSQAIELLE